MLADKLIVVDANAVLWAAVQPWLDSLLQLEQHDEDYTWYGWKKSVLNAFLERLPDHCTLLIGVWETSEPEQQDKSLEAEVSLHSEPLLFGCLCEVLHGAVCSIRTFEALSDADLPPVNELAPSYQHALILMRAARVQVAPVAWALFTDRKTWNEWLFSEVPTNTLLAKDELLATLTQQGRCVLMGSQTAHRHP